ncbi:Uncharacterised protein [Sphingobacterium mizutaii]|uniref:Uncharacterized protein n=2 Tax=Sphingobacterium mizutaii TaxID=1010 RepID=A0AAJ5C0L4_9SPHI|nr:hypothetical protein SAMN05192578_1011284 [Sphingobacterium mizutaii]SNV51451.1 Uncharacterised protein [Sphingobacterium mizutaii]
MLVGVYCINPLTFEPGCSGWEDRPRFGERTRIQWMGGLAKIKSQNYRHVGRGLLHKPAAYLNQDVRDRRIDQDLGREPGFNGWEDWPRSKVRITAMLVGVYCINPLQILNKYFGLHWRTGSLPSVKNDRHILWRSVQILQ